jgi:putative sterol carrier protein
MDGMMAFMQGKLQLAGDLNLAMKLTTMFKMKS